MYKKYFLLFTLFFFYSLNANSATTNWQESEGKGAKTRLIASFYEDSQGNKKILAGLEFKISKGWKIYGNSSDGIGLPPSFDLSKTNNYLSHKVVFPQSIIEEEKIGNETLKYEAYHDEVIFPIEIDLAQNNQAKLDINLNYGLCKDVCIPVSQSFSLEIANEIDKETLESIENFYPQKANDEKNKNNSLITLISKIIIAIIGGAILNVMPCVLPILSIKLLSIIDHANAKISRIRFAFFSTICGILLCFAIFAVVVSIIRIAGSSFGWGFQFQNPYFLIFLLVVTTLVSGNLLGIFEISFNEILATFLDKKITKAEKEKNIFIPNFLSGILAVLLATPCSAPFLGSAISFALTEDFITIFIIFLAIGVGFSLPYILLIMTPKLVYLLPKPGLWMIKIKKIMALFMILTTLWLAYILHDNIGLIPTIITAILSILLLLCLKIKSITKRLFITVFLGALIIFVPIKLHQIIPTDHKTKMLENIWMEFDEEKLYELVNQGNVVVVDVTADWCLTCKVNKKRVLRDSEVINKLKSPNVIAMRADITKSDEKIMEFLRKHNRFAIPFNAVYGPNSKEGLLTSELLNKKDFLELIEKAK
jgi:suppressor for copper-sensitivity B